MKQGLKGKRALKVLRYVKNFLEGRKDHDSKQQLRKCFFKYKVKSRSQICTLETHDVILAY